MSVSVRAIVLAAGKGTRMKSQIPKVLHHLCGRAMLWYVLRALRDVGVAEIVVVSNDELEPHVAGVAEDAGHVCVRTVRQEPQLGTGHAVQVALAVLEPADGTLLVLNGDMPLVDAAVIRYVLGVRGAALALATARMPLPSSYGRIVRKGKGVARIVEERDATDDERSIDEMNAGLYAYDERKLRAAAAELKNDNAQREYYLTDTVGALVAKGEAVTPVLVDDFHSVLGVNDRVELAEASRRINLRICERHMRAGVTIADPSTTYLEPDLEIASDVTILPNTTIGRKSSIGSASEIGPNSRLQHARIGRHVVIADSVIADSEIGDFSFVGPWAHIREGSVVSTGVRVGNFVEVKSATLGPGSKAGHLAYIGDASVGARANVGAGTITCNYDGSKKNRTEIGEDAFIGSNSSLVAPVRVGDGALIGAGAVVIRDVPAHERVAGNPAKPLRKKAPTERA
jgi:bifunctional UDP-N-acetylglucosamine pyrophosphorylase/glucosamine-1-phosphate N-acetyltransferase